VRTGVCAYVYACARVHGRIDNNRRARASTGVYEHLIRACVRACDLDVRVRACVPYIRASRRVYLTHIGEC
jgi:hypothetical protein